MYNLHNIQYKRNTKGLRSKQGVPLMLGDEFNDNREEHDSLIATQNGNTAQYNVSSIVSFL